MAKQLRPRILFCSTYKPLGPGCGDAFSCTAQGGLQLTWAQEGFRAEDTMWHWGLDLIAENLDAPSVVLHYPTWRTFIREIRRGYELVGFTFNVCTLHRIRRMVRAVRTVSPESRIVLGGYGTILPDEDLVDEGGRPLGDWICREEGIGFMRRLLGESQGPIRHPDIAIGRKILSVRLKEKTGIVLSSVGCPGGCDFCTTSHYFGRRQIHFQKNGADVFFTMADMADRDPDITSISIIDEDFLADSQRGLDFLEASRRSGRFLDVMMFASLRSLSRFQAAEIAAMGVSRVWIGFEAEQSGYAKLEGRGFAQQVAELRAYGISVAASMIIGYDYQDRETIEQEFERVCRSGASAIQILLFSPCYGTPAWRRLEREGRLRGDTRKDYRLYDGFTLLFNHPQFSAQELESLQRDLSRREYLRLGPSVFRLLAVHHEGWSNLKDSPDPYLRHRAAVSAQRLRRSLVLYPVGIRYAPSPEVRQRLEKEYARMTEDFGRMSIVQRIIARALVLLYPISRRRLASDRFTQPPTIRRVYPSRRPPNHSSEWMSPASLATRCAPKTRGGPS